MDEPGPPTEPQCHGVIVARPIVSGRDVPAPTPSPLELVGLSRGAAAGGVGLVLLVLLGTLLPSAVGGLFFTPHVSERTPARFHAAIIVDKWVSALVAVGFVAVFLRWSRISAASFGLRLERFRAQAAWGLAALCGVYAAFVVSLIVVGSLILLFPGVQEDLSRRVEFLGLLPVNDLAGAVLLLIPVAIHEELLFRGLLIPVLRRVGCGWTAAVLVSAALFALLHVTQGWLAIPQVFCIGAALGAFFVLSRSLTAVIIAHFLFDLLQLQLIRVLQPWVEELTKHA